MKTGYRETLIKTAVETWEHFAFLNCKTDAAVNDLLETISGSDYGYDKNGEPKTDDPIIDTFRWMSNSRLRLFVKKAKNISE